MDIWDRLRSTENLGDPLCLAAADEIERLRTMNPRGDFPEYSGMSYEQASREADRIITRDGWFKSWARLAFLREIMMRQKNLIQ